MSSLVSTSPSTRRSPNRPCRNDIIWPWEQDVSWQSLLIDHSSHDRFDIKKPISMGRADFSQDGMVPAPLIETPTSSLPDHTQPLFRADLDPYCVDRNLTMYYIGQFLKHLDPILEECIPRDVVMPWVMMTCTTKTAEDKMLLYAMMAMGAGAGAGSGQGERSHKDGHVFASIAHSLLFTTTTTHHSRSYSHSHDGHGQGEMETTNCGDHDMDNDHDRESLQRALTRLTLAMLAVSQGRCSQALELCHTSPSRREHCGVDSPPMTPLPTATWELMLDQDKLIRCRRTVAWCLRLIGSLASSWSMAPRQSDLSST